MAELLNRFAIRRATHSDYTKVMDIDRYIYSGNDYLGEQYKIWMHDTNSNCFLLAEDDKVVSFGGLRDRVQSSMSIKKGNR